jgi:biotin carboxyl carrier protein
VGSNSNHSGPPSVDVQPLGEGRYRVVEGARQRVAYAAGPPHARWVFLDGRVYVVDTGKLAGRNSRAHDDEMALAAPMPATVSALHVGEGDEVAEGDVMVTLEAMKMELLVRAPRAGRVRSLRCKVGDLVQPGVPLAEIE